MCPWRTLHPCVFAFGVWSSCFSCCFSCSALQRWAEMLVTGFFQACWLSGWGQCYVHRTFTIFFIFFQCYMQCQFILKSFFFFSSFQFLCVSSTKLILRAVFDIKDFFEKQTVTLNWWVQMIAQIASNFQRLSFSKRSLPSIITSLVFNFRLHDLPLSFGYNPYNSCPRGR